MNRDLNAQAFTHKQDLYFSAGKAPAKDALTAHELTHVVQQTGKVQRQGIPSDKESGGNVRFLGFLNTGTGITKRPLGPNLLTPYMTNGVELEFEVASSIFNKFQNIRPVQWAGPRAVWIKQGNPITQPWQNYLQDAGTGSDDPKKILLREIPLLTGILQVQTWKNMQEIHEFMLFKISLDG